MKAEKMRKQLQKVESDICRETQLHCANNNILWTRKHTELLKNGLQEYLARGLWPIIEDIFKEDAKDKD
jgi:hypothetical protein